MSQFQSATARAPVNISTHSFPINTMVQCRIMEGLEFSEEKEFSRRESGVKQSTFIKLVLKTGLVRTEQGAQYVLLMIIGLCVVLILFLLIFGGNKVPPPPAPLYAPAS